MHDIGPTGNRSSTEPILYFGKAFFEPVTHIMEKIVTELDPKVKPSLKVRF